MFRDYLIYRILRISPIELPFWISAFCWAFLPATLTSTYFVLTIPISAKYALILLTGYLYTCVLFKNRHRIGSHLFSGSRLGLFFFLLIVYAFLSLTWSNLSFRDTAGMALTLLLTLSAFTVGFTITGLHTPDSLYGFVSRVSVFLSAVGAIYTAESFFSLGLRTGSGANWTDFGIERVRGPLFGSSIGHFILLPAFSWCVQILIQYRQKRLWPAIPALVLAVTIMSTGSRAAMATLLLFGVLIIPYAPSSKRVYAIFTLCIVAVIALAITFSRASYERLTSLEATGREQVHAATWEMFTSRDIISTLRGQGYGAIWSWYLPDSEAGGARGTRRNIIETEFGWMPYHPHSLLILLSVELGLPGLLFFVYLTATLGAALWQKRRSRDRYSIFSCGLVASYVSVFLDLFIFKTWAIALFWWIFLFAGLRLRSESFNE